LNEVNIPNLFHLMIDVFVFKIGGSDEKRRIYDFNIACDHYIGGLTTLCIEDEFCQYDHLVPRDLNTIQTGFNAYKILTILFKTHPDHPSLAEFHQDMSNYDILNNKKIYQDNIYKTISN
jgi:hypothetical protein